jgi:CDP-4-dehydro-6-deoxyglucose reductase
VRISVSKANNSFSAVPDRSVLDAALDAGLNLPHSCKSGACGACRARLLTGEVDYPNGAPLGLTAAEASEGLILLCQAHARTDLSLELFDVSVADQALIKRLPCRIERVEQWSHDVLGVFVRLPAAERFDFLPGQYIDFLLPGGRRRSFSIASPPHDSRLLELHVRRVSGGEFTEPLFCEPAGGALLTMQGPFGHFVYRTPEPPSCGNDAPMLLLGGGTGLAPLQSILRHAPSATSMRGRCSRSWRGAPPISAGCPCSRKPLRIGAAAAAGCTRQCSATSSSSHATTYMPADRRR